MPGGSGRRYDAMDNPRRCAMCGKSEEESDTLRDHIRSVYVRSDGSLARGYFKPTGLTEAERGRLKDDAAAFGPERAVCTDRAACRRRAAALVRDDG